MHRTSVISEDIFTGEKRCGGQKARLTLQSSTDKLFEVQAGGRANKIQRHIN